MTFENILQVHSQFSSLFDPELLEDLREMVFHGLFTDEKLSADFPVLDPSTRHLYDLELPSGKCRQSEFLPSVLL